MDILYQDLWNDILMDEDRFVEISPYSHWIACGGSHRTLRLYRAGTGQKVLPIHLPAPLNSLCPIAFPAEGFICGHEDGSLTAVHMMGAELDDVGLPLYTTSDHDKLTRAS